MFEVQPVEGGHLVRCDHAWVILKLFLVINCHSVEMITSVSSRMLPRASLSSRILLMVTTPAVFLLLLHTRTPATTPAAASSAISTPTTIPATGAEEEELWSGGESKNY